MTIEERGSDWDRVGAVEIIRPDGEPVRFGTPRHVELRGEWGVIEVTYDDEGELRWEAQTTADRMMMKHVLEVARDEFSDGLPLSDLEYHPSLILTAADRMAEEFRGEVVVVYVNEPLEEDAIP